MGKAPDKTGDLLQGTLEVLILKTLSHGEMHGYAVAESIHAASLKVLTVEEGALYPALHRMEARGLLSSTWGTSENNRRAKYYRLTRAGRSRLEQTTVSWIRTRTAIDKILETT